MKLVFPLALSVLLIAVSCGGSGEKKILSIQKKTVVQETAKVVPNRELSVEVSGMSCEQSCGGTIRMALKETGGVDRCSFDFKENRKTNTAFITFDKDKISADKIIAIIQQLNDGQFTTANAKTKTIESAEATIPAASRNVSARTVKAPARDEIVVATPEVEFPNLFELLPRAAI